jgi:outer membrane protein OmpA-like peptidoglycan-associated protein
VLIFQNGKKMRIYLVFTLIFGIQLFAQDGDKVTVYFDFNKSELTPDAVRTINDYLALGKDIEVTKIYGFCDWIGSNRYNDSLSMQRVASVHHYLKSKQVKIRADYEQKGFGEDFTQSEVQSENRKVLILFLEIPKPVVPVTAHKSLADRIKEAKVGDLLKLENINFFNNSATILPKSRPLLLDLLCIMEENPNLKIEIQGHICCQTQSDVNDISTARARAIYNFLIRKKINRKRMTYKGYGVTRPIFPIPEKSEEEADANRRVEILIVEK